jgi:hypothetical protein
MLLIEKFLKDLNVEKVDPISDKCGLLCYYTNDAVKGTAYNFTYYNWENGKNHPGYYVFKYFTAGETYQNLTSFMVKDTAYTSWSDFFVQIEKIKKEILSASQYKVASNGIEANNMLWRAFLKSQDVTLASIYGTLPSSFFASVDDNLTAIEQKKGREKFLQHIKDRYYMIYNNWTYFFELDVEVKFCQWFYEYSNK